MANGLLSLHKEPMLSEQASTAYMIQNITRKYWPSVSSVNTSNAHSVVFHPKISRHVKEIYVTVHVTNYLLGHQAIKLYHIIHGL